MATGTSRMEGRGPRHKRRRSLIAHLTAHIRLIIAVLVGIAVWLVYPYGEGLIRVLVSWNIAGWLYVALIWIMMARAEVDGIRRQASLEDESRTVLLVLVILGSLATILAIVAQLSALAEDHGPDRTFKFALTFSTILVSWLLIHLVFALYYAHEFHSEGRIHRRGRGGGLEFPGEDIPDYFDFLYFSLTVGMTAQTSDVAVSSHRMRRIVVAHGFLSFLFNTTVIALVVNLTAQIAG